MATSVKTKDRHLKTRKNAADARSIYTRKRRVREAAELEKTTLFDRTGKNIQKVYSHPIWGKVAGVATVLILTLLAKKTGEAIKRHTNIDSKGADKMVKVAKVAQGVISSPAGLANLFQHLYNSMLEGASDASAGAKPSTPDASQTLTDLTTALHKAATANNQVLKVEYTKDGINYYLDNSIYGAHYNVAKEIFKDNPIFGVGIKNYRIESFNKKYDDLDHKENNKRGNTHPHQTHYEFLSETGLFGYSAFLTFIIISFGLFLKNYKKDKNIYQLSGMIYILVALIPLLPSGSFFSTYTSGLFWLNYAIMAGYIKK